MSDNQYNPVACEHKLPTGLTAWSFQSEEQSNVNGANKVSIHVCLLCGEISIGGYRPSKDEKHVNTFHETFNIYHPDAIDAIIKQANFYNEEAKWERLHPSESAGVCAVWVKGQFDRLPVRQKVVAKMYHEHMNREVVGFASSSTGEMVTFDWGTGSVSLIIGHEELNNISWLYESTAAQGKEDAVAVMDWVFENRRTIVHMESASQLYDIYQSKNK